MSNHSLVIRAGIVIHAVKRVAPFLPPPADASIHHSFARLSSSIPPKPSPAPRSSTVARSASAVAASSSKPTCAFTSYAFTSLRRQRQCQRSVPCTGDTTMCGMSFGGPKLLCCGILRSTVPFCAPCAALSDVLTCAHAMHQVRAVQGSSDQGGDGPQGELVTAGLSSPASTTHAAAVPCDATIFTADAVAPSISLFTPISISPAISLVCGVVRLAIIVLLRRLFLSVPLPCFPASLLPCLLGRCVRRSGTRSTPRPTSAQSSPSNTAKK